MMNIMSDIQHTIDSQFLRYLPSDRGLILDFQEAAENLPENTGDNYIRANDYRIKGAFTQNGDARKQRKQAAQTHIIATYNAENISNLPDAIAPAMVIKRKGDMHLSLPEVYETALSRVHTAAKDTLHLCGAEYFKNAEFLLNISRTNVNPNESQRPVFAKPHQHTNSDLIYLSNNTLGTIIEGKGPAPEQSIIRFGGEEWHRSQINTTNETIRKEWCALIVNAEQQTMKRHIQNNRSENTVLHTARDTELFNQFKDRAEGILNTIQNVMVFDTPVIMQQQQSKERREDVAETIEYT